MLVPAIDDIEHQLPCDEGIWSIGNWEAWSLYDKDKSPGALTQETCASVISSLFAGREPSRPISWYGLLSVAAGLLAHVLMSESVVILGGDDDDHVRNISRIETALRTYEAYWQKQPAATRHPLEYRDGPLLPDCVPLLAMAYYHLYAPTKLRLLKQILRTVTPNSTPPPAASWDHEMQRSWSSVLLFRANDAQHLTKAAKIAASAMYHRAQLGFGYVGRTAPIKMGFHYVNAAFEGGK